MSNPRHVAANADALRAAFTLLETLIVIALLATIAALALPAVMGTFQQRSFEAAVDVSVQQLLIARAHAQANGRPVEVIYEPHPPRVEARFFAIDLQDESGRAFPAGPDAPAAPMQASGDWEDESQIAEGWAWRKLPRDVRITRQLPAEVLDRRLHVPATLPEDIVIAEETPSSPPPLRLAVFLADGSALISQSAWLSDGEGRAVRLTVNAWTGLPQVERVDEVLSAEVETEAEEPPPPEEAIDARAG